MLRRTFTCDICQRVWTSYSTFVSHMASVHLIEGPFEWKNPKTGKWEPVTPKDEEKKS